MESNGVTCGREFCEWEGKCEPSVAQLKTRSWRRSATDEGRCLWLFFFFFWRTALRRNGTVMRKRISSTACRARPGRKSQTMFDTCVRTDYPAPVTRPLRHGRQSLQTQEKAYQTQAAVRATPRAPCPNYSWRWPRLWDLSWTC